MKVEQQTKHLPLFKLHNQSTKPRRAGAEQTFDKITRSETMSST